MSWLKIDDAIGEHRKTRRLLRSSGTAAFGLHALALVHCSRYLTDGHVEAEFVDETLDAARVKGKARAALTDALVAHGQWTIDEDGWQIHDYLDHNPSREQVLAAREKERIRKAKGRETQAAGRQDTGDPGSDVPDDVREPSGRTDPGTDDGIQQASSGPVPLPSHSRPEEPPHPLTGEPGKRPSFDGRAIPDTRWRLALATLAEFDRQAGTTYASRAVNGRGKLSDNAQRLIGALTADPTLDLERCTAMIEEGLRPDRQFWAGRPEPRHIFAPGVIEGLFAATEPRHLQAVPQHAGIRDDVDDSDGDLTVWTGR